MQISATCKLFVNIFVRTVLTDLLDTIVCNCQHCDEQQFQTLSCVHYKNFSVVKLDLFIRALLLDRILALEKTTRTPRVHLVLCWRHTEQLYSNAGLMSEI